MMTTTFMAGCKYTGAKAAYSNDRRPHVTAVAGQFVVFLRQAGKQSLDVYAGPVFVSTTFGLGTAVVEVGTTGTAVGVTGTDTACRE